MFTHFNGIVYAIIMKQWIFMRDKAIRQTFSHTVLGACAEKGKKNRRRPYLTLSRIQRNVKYATMFEQIILNKHLNVSPVRKQYAYSLHLTAAQFCAPVNVISRYMCHIMADEMSWNARTTTYVYVDHRKDSSFSCVYETLFLSRTEFDGSTCDVSHRQTHTYSPIL